MENTPPYWGTKKGIILESIAINWRFTFNDVSIATDIDYSELYDLIGELMSENMIYVFEDQYRVNKETYHEYWNYAVHFTDLPEKKHKETIEINGIPSKNDFSSDLIDWINIWVRFQQNYEYEISINNNHFYLDGSLLANFIHDLIRRAKIKITYVSPWIEEIGVTKTLMSASSHNRKVIVLTRKPDWSAKSDWDNRQTKIYKKCHSNLSKSGATVCYNNEIHGKVLLVDGLVAVVSSFNLLKNPASGISWEAGLVTFDSTIVNSIEKSIDSMMVQN